MAALLLAIAGRAQASESVYWFNYEGHSISFSATDGSGGGILNLGVGGEGLQGPEGMAFDPTSGRMYVVNQWNDTITWAAVDGTGGGVLETPGATVEDPGGVTIDPRTQIIYWSNQIVSEGGQGDRPEGAIEWAHLDGSGGGVLNTEGAQTTFPTYPVVDTADNRVYWANSFGAFSGFSWASLDGTGGGEIPIDGGPTPYNLRGLNVDPGSGRLYWSDLFTEGGDEPEVARIGWTNLSGSGGGAIDASVSRFNAPYGLAFDPEKATFYWGNWDNGSEREDAIGTLTLSGVGGGITPAAAPVSGPQSPIILKSPIGTQVPQVTRKGTALTCSQGNWSQDYPGSFVYGAPDSYSYQWLLNGTAISEATSSAYTATAAGAYSCAVTGTNISGSGVQTSGSVAVKSPTLSMALQTAKVKVKAGKAAKVTVNLANSGDLPSVAVRVCPEMNKKAKKGLKVPYCASVAPIAAGGSASATLNVKTKKGAAGTYKFKLLVKGEGAGSVVASVKVTPKKKKH